MALTQLGPINPVKIVDSADPPGVVYNRSTTTQVFWGPSEATATRADASILDPNATLAVNEDAEVWMVAAAGTVAVDYHPNGVAFFRGLTNGNGKLVLPAMQSPNFQTGVTGWSINQDGTAEFNSLTIRNGQIISGVFLMYSSPIPAKGNLICAIAPTAGTDSVGNNYGQGLNLGVWDAVTGNQKQHFGIDSNGKLYLVNSSGNTTIFADPNLNYLAVYTPGTGANNLVSSIGTGGLDDFSNTLISGHASYGATIASALGNGTLTLYSAASQAGPWTAQTTIQFNTGSPDFTRISGPGAGASPIMDFLRGGSIAVQVSASGSFSVNGGAFVNLNTSSADPTLITTDNWHPVTPSANWSSSGANYALLPIGVGGFGKGAVALRGEMISTANTGAGSQMFTVPFTFVSNQDYDTPTNLSGNALGNRVVRVTAAGGVQAQPTGTSGNFVILDGIIAWI